MVVVDHPLLLPHHLRRHQRALRRRPVQQVSHRRRRRRNSPGLTAGVALPPNGRGGRRGRRGSRGGASLGGGCSRGGRRRCSRGGLGLVGGGDEVAGAGERVWKWDCEFRSLLSEL